MKSDIHLWAEEMLKRNGWYAHYVFDDSSCPYSVNIHTHGLPAKYEHLDLQMCFPLDARLAHDILCEIVFMVSEGIKFTPGIKYKNILQYADVEFAEAKDDGRIVLRVILPDKDGNLRGDRVDQWGGCRIYPSNN